MIVLTDSWQPLPHILATVLFSVAIIAYLTLMIIYNKALNDVRLVGTLSLGVAMAISMNIAQLDLNLFPFCRCG